MSATFDSTTKAAYDAATTAQARAEAIVASLTGTISVKVFNGSNTEMGSGTMAAPWATAVNNGVVIGEVTEFTVGTTATPDADWYIRFQNADVSRWARGSFGLLGSGQDYTWSLPAWTATDTGIIGTAYIIPTGNQAPAFTVAPTSASIAGTGGAIQFTAVDPEGGSVFYSLTTTRNGITINASGLVTVTAAAAGTSGNIVVQASDGILTASATCAVTVASVISIGLDYDAPFESVLAPFFTSTGGTGAIVAVNATHAREGTKSLLTHCPTAACWRAEVSLGYGGCVPMQQASWYGWSVYADDNWIGDFNTWEAFGQWHTRDDTMSPPIAFETGYRSGYGTGNLLFRVSWSGSGPPTSFTGNQIWNLGRMDDLKGQWLDFVMYFVPSSTSTGQLRLWMNGTEVASRLNAPNYIADSIGPYWKMGIYNGWKDGASTPGVTERKAWWDNYRQVTDPSATYETVAPIGNRLLAP